MNDDVLQTAGLSGDHGWNEADDGGRLGGVGTALLVLTTSTYCALVWLLAGFPPLAFLASRKGIGDRA